MRHFLSNSRLSLLSSMTAKTCLSPSQTCSTKCSLNPRCSGNLSAAICFRNARFSSTTMSPPCVKKRRRSHRATKRPRQSNKKQSPLPMAKPHLSLKGRSLSSTTTRLTTSTVVFKGRNATPSSKKHTSKSP